MDINNIELKLDVHTHTLASGHAYGTIREMAQAASEKGLEILGVSEHSEGIPGTCNHMYFRNLQAIPRQLYGVKIMVGAEINILNGGRLSMEDSLIERLDYAIAGIHNQCYKHDTKEANTNAVIAAIKHPKINIISHPDDGEFPLDYEKIVLAAKEHNTLLEVNNNSFRKGDKKRLNCYANNREMLYYCKKYKVPVIFSSDAHDPSEVADMKYVYEQMKEIDFPEELVINTSVEKFLRMIYCTQTV